MNFLDDCNFSYYDKEKSDVFTLAAILLETALLKDVKLYDPKKKASLLENIPVFLKEVKQSGYTPNFVETLERMLNAHGRNRPHFAEIVGQIEN